MALLPDVFVPDEADDNPFATIKEPGWLPMEIIKSEYKKTNSGDGAYFSFHFKVTDDMDNSDNIGKMFFANLNWVNNSDVAVKIGKADMKKICKAVGFDGELEDTTDLHNMPMMVYYTYKEGTAQWPDKNELKDFLSFEDFNNLES